MKGFGELRLPIFEEIASASVLGDQQCQKRHPYLLNALSHSRYDNQQRRLHKCTLQPSIVTSQSIEKNLVVHGCSACTMVISSQGTKGCDAPMISNGLFLSASKLSKSSIESSAPYYLALTDSNMSQKRKRGVIDAAEGRQENASGLHEEILFTQQCNPRCPPMDPKRVVAGVRTPLGHRSNRHGRCIDSQIWSRPQFPPSCTTEDKLVLSDGYPQQMTTLLEKSVRPAVQPSAQD